MSHASRATITFGNTTPAPQPESASAQNQGSVQYPWRQKGRSREGRHRQNVPEHHLPAYQAEPSDLGAVYTAKPSVEQTPTNLRDDVMQQAQFHVQPAPNVPQSGDVRRTSGGRLPAYQAEPSELGAVYTPKPTVQPSHLRDDVMQQAQFHVQPAPNVQQSGDVRYTYGGQDASLTNHPGTQAPAIQLSSQRSREASEKLAALNLSPQALAMYKKRFNVLDLNKDGVVNLREFAAISRVLGYKFTKEEVLEIFGKRDVDDSGGISFDEFVLAMHDRASKAKELAPYRAKFREYDWKDTGYITSDEAYPVLHKLLGFDENKTESLIDMYDKNRDYRLSLLEFVDFYKKVEELKAKVLSAFRDFDQNRDGYVDLNELKAKLQAKRFTDEQVQGVMYKYDRDGDGMLNYQEFAAFWDIPIV